jgi:hypothetical protein
VGLGFSKGNVFMQNTVSKITHEHANSKHLIGKNHIAKTGLLEKIKFEQWHIFDELRRLTRNINVINLASLLAVFPRMGIYAYEISQADIAEKMSSLFEMQVPARNTISKWEKELETLGFLQIPRHVDWRASKTKVRIITEKFWTMSRRGLERVSYDCPHVTFCAGKVERVTQDNPKDPNDPVKILNSKIRARETTVVNDAAQSRAVSQNKKFLRPPKKDPALSSRLNKFENSVVWWLFQNKNLESYRQGLIIAGRFLELAGDDYYQQLKKAWADCRDASRPGMVSGIIRHLRDIGERSMGELSSAVGRGNPIPPMVSLSPQDVSVEHIDEDLEIFEMKKAMFFGGEYHGPHGDLVADFRDASPERMDEIIDALAAGLIPPVVKKVI